MATHPRAASLMAGPHLRVGRTAASRTVAARERGVVSRRALEGATVIVRSRWRRVPRLLLLALLLVAVGTLGIYQVLQTSRIAEVGYELRTLQSERTRLAAEVRLLEARAAGLARDGELEGRATTDLGMVEPTTTLRVTVGVPATSTMTLPERFLPHAGEPPEAPASWWHRLLERLPGGGK